MLRESHDCVKQTALLILSNSFFQKGAHQERYKLPSYHIKEGDFVNTDVTSAGATLALGLVFFDTHNRLQRLPYLHVIDLILKVLPLILLYYLHSFKSIPVLILNAVRSFSGWRIQTLSIFWIKCVRIC